MAESFAIVTSVLALVVSMITAWLTLFHRGRLRMTTPSMIAFGYDAGRAPGVFEPKVMVRCLLFSTGERGNAIETLFLRLRRGDSAYLFGVWGLQATTLERGGGLFVGRTGVTAWHHFVATSAACDFRFELGPYDLEVWARVDGQERATQLWAARVSLQEHAALTRHDGREQVWFDREPESGELIPRLRSAAGFDAAT
jgi:hypothetical protein